jgi:hypothetical protein
LEIEKGQAFKLVALQRSTSLIPKGGGSMAQHHHIGPAGTGEENGPSQTRGLQVKGPLNTSLGDPVWVCGLAINNFLLMIGS